MTTSKTGFATPEASAAIQYGTSVTRPATAPASLIDGRFLSFPRDQPGGKPSSGSLDRGVDQNLLGEEHSKSVAPSGSRFEGPLVPRLWSVGPLGGAGLIAAADDR
jgi:hypothetical protein